MGKHKRYHKAEQRAQQAPGTPWYASTGFKIGVGIFGIAAVILMFFLVSNALNPGTPPGSAPGDNTELEGGSQVIRMAVSGYQYTPDTFTVQQNVPVKFVIDGTQAGGCTSYIVSREFGFSQRLNRGENIIEFTPTRKGTFQFACGMNMVSGTITVV